MSSNWTDETKYDSRTKAKDRFMTKCSIRFGSLKITIDRCHPEFKGRWILTCPPFLITFAIAPYETVPRIAQAEAVRLVTSHLTNTLEIINRNGSVG